MELDRAFRLDFRYSWVFWSSREPSPCELRGAVSELGRAVSAHPHCASLLAWRGDTRRRAGDLSGALVDLSRAAALDPGHANSHAFLGRALLESGRAEEAAERLRRAATLSPSQPIFAGWLAQALWRGGKRAQALTALARLLKVVPPVQLWWVLQLRAELRLEEGRPGPALADLRAAQRCEGRHADGYFLSARAHLALGDVRGGQREVEKALAIAPNMGRAYLLRAQARGLLGRCAGVLADYRVVAERFPVLLNDDQRSRVAALLEAVR
jgi:predicted Zn-dependent protease